LIDKHIKIREMGKKLFSTLKNKTKYLQHMQINNKIVTRPSKAIKVCPSCNHGLKTKQSSIKVRVRHIIHKRCYIADLSTMANVTKHKSRASGLRVHKMV
jgi:hypothetical protein